MPTREGVAPWKLQQVRRKRRLSSAAHPPNQRGLPARAVGADVRSPRSQLRPHVSPPAPRTRAPHIVSPARSYNRHDMGGWYKAELSGIHASGVVTTHDDMTGWNSALVDLLGIPQSMGVQQPCRQRVTRGCSDPLDELGDSELRRRQADRGRTEYDDIPCANLITSHAARKDALPVGQRW